MTWKTISLFLFGAALFYAPLAHGSTTRATIMPLNILLLAAAAAGLLHKLVARERIRIPLPPLVCVLLLGAIGSLHVLNARFEINPLTQDFIPRSRPIPFLPAALDRVSAFACAFDLAALGAAFLVLTDLAQHRAERWRLLATVAVSGFTVALLGICLKLSGHRTLPFSSEGAQYLFASYLYHGNAAAFLNLCWPAALALSARAIQSQNYVGIAIWTNSFVFTFGALFVNASKFGHALAIPTLLLAGWLAWRCANIRWNASPAVVTTTATVLVASLLILTLPMLAVSLERWETLLQRGESSRGITSQAALRMIADAPLWGIGPGGFRWGFPFYTAHLGDAIRGLWIHAHNDYVETLVDWGIVGGCAWMVLIGGGLLRGWSKLLRGAKELSTAAAVVALSITAVHCVIDFPLQIASLRYFAVIFLAILWGGKELERGRRQRTPRPAEPA